MRYKDWYRRRVTGEKFGGPAMDEAGAMNVVLGYAAARRRGTLGVSDNKRWLWHISPASEGGSFDRAGHRMPMHHCGNTKKTRHEAQL